MADIPVKMLVLQLDQPPEEHAFEQGMIKVGRGRPGKARKGVDLQLKDPDVARVHAVIHVNKLDDVCVMPMGTAATYINSTKVKSKERVKSGTVIEMGTTQITIYIGEDAAQSYLPTEAPLPPPAAEPEAFSVSHGEIAIGSGEFEVVEESPASVTDMNAAIPEAPATTPPVSVASDQQATPTASGTFAGQNMSLYPMHTEPEGTFGPMGPTPAPLPEDTSQPSVALLLDVFDRLGKESWYTEEKFW